MHAQLLRALSPHSSEASFGALRCSRAPSCLELFSLVVPSTWRALPPGLPGLLFLLLQALVQILPPLRPSVTKPSVWVPDTPSSSQRSSSCSPVLSLRAADHRLSWAVYSLAHWSGYLLWPLDFELMSPWIMSFLFTTRHPVLTLHWEHSY